MAPWSRADGAEAVWYNPAGLGDLPGGSLSANTSLFERQLFRASAGDLSNRETVFVQVPSFVGGNLRVSENPWVPNLAFAIVTPQQWNQNVFFNTDFDFEGQEGRVGIHSQSSLNTLRPVLGAGLRLNDTWSVGARIDGMYTTINNLQSIDWRIRNANNSLSAIRTETQSSDASLYQLSAGFGVQYEPNPQWSFGMHIQLPSLPVQTDGRITYQYYQDDADETVEVIYSSQDLEANLREPFNLHFGTAYTSKRWSAELTARWYSALASQEIVERQTGLEAIIVDKESGDVTTVNDREVAFTTLRLDNIITLSLGGRYRISENYILHGAYIFDPSPVSTGEQESDITAVDLQTVRFGFTREREIIFIIIRLRRHLGQQRRRGDARLRKRHQPRHRSARTDQRQCDYCHHHAFLKKPCRQRNISNIQKILDELSSLK